jgi:hypothetical protein
MYVVAFAPHSHKKCRRGEAGAAFFTGTGGLDA